MFSKGEKQICLPPEVMAGLEVKCKALGTKQVLIVPVVTIIFTISVIYFLAVSRV